MSRVWSRRGPYSRLGFNYFGPVDGHDLNTLVPILRNLYQLKGPRFLHIVTQKGKGYFPAEADPSRYHGIGKFDTSTGETTAGKRPIKHLPPPFSDWLCDMAAEDLRLIGITPAMREGSGLVEFSNKFPDRYFDVGIAEQHAITSGRWHGMRRLETGGCDLFNIPTAWLRSTDSRRGDAKPAGPVCDRSRRHRRR